LEREKEVKPVLGGALFHVRFGALDQFTPGRKKAEQWLF